MDHLRKLLPELLRMSPLLGTVVVVQTWLLYVRVCQLAVPAYYRVNLHVRDKSEIQFRELKGTKK